MPFSHPGPFLIQSTTNSFEDSLFTWIQIFPVMFLFHPATVAWWDTFLQAATNFLWDPQFPRVSFFGSPCRPTVNFQPLHRFFCPLTDFTTAFSLGTF
jgi:hypothetical protein